MAFDLEIGTATVWMEASGEGPEGQTAVAHVLVNRVWSGKWGRNVADVCLWPAQFSCWGTSDPNRRRLAEAHDDDPMLAQCRAAVQGAMSGITPDPTGRALYYFTDAIEPPSWAAGMTETVHIGHHRFFKP